MMTVARTHALLALLPLAASYLLPTLTPRRTPPRIFLQEAEPDEYIPGLDLDVRSHHEPPLLLSVEPALTDPFGCAQPPPPREPLPGLPRRFSEGTGPFTVSHGVPIDENETSPAYLTAMDWHISASYTAEQLEEITAKEKAETDLAAERLEDLEEKRRCAPLIATPPNRPSPAER